MVSAGDIFTVGASATRIFSKWPLMEQEFNEIKYRSQLTYRKHSGEHIIGPIEMGPPPVPGAPPPPMFIQSRPRFHAMLYRQVQKIGIPVEFGQRVMDYYEDEAAGKGGVVVEDGSRFEADVVIAADGFSSKSSKLIAGELVKARSSGFAVYRTAYPVELALVDPAVKAAFGFRNGRPQMQFMVG